MTTSPQKTPLAAPVAPRRPHSFTTHGITVTDDYAWLKDANWQEVLRDPVDPATPISASYLEAENAYTESLLGHTDRPAEDAGRGDARADQGRRFQRAVAGRALRLFPQIPRGRPARNVRPHAARRRRRPRSSSTATSWPPTRTISSSAARGIRPTTGSRPGAPTSRARNISRSGCATGPTARTMTTWSRKPTAAWCGAPDCQALLLRQARRQSSPDAGLAPSPRHAAGRRCAGLRGSRIPAGSPISMKAPAAASA